MEGASHKNTIVFESIRCMLARGSCLLLLLFQVPPRHILSAGRTLTPFFIRI